MAFKKESGIYKVECLTNGRVYIGQTTRLRERMYQQRYYLNRNESHHPLLQEDWDKYGEKSFEFKIVEYCKDLDKKERYWIEHYKAFEEGYNTTTGGITGNKQDERQKKHRSSIMAGKNNPMYFKARGSGNPNSKLHEEQVVKIKHFVKRDYPDSEIIKMFDLTKNQFQKIKHNRTWSHITV